MDQHQPPQISSFVLRFVQEEPVNLAGNHQYRGSIRHIQTDQEISFTHWRDAIHFISQYIPLDSLDLPEPQNQNLSDRQEPA